MHDWERLILARKTLASMETLDKKGTVSYFLFRFRKEHGARDRESSWSHLRRENQRDRQALVLFSFLTFVVRLALARWPEANFDCMIRIMQKATIGEKKIDIKQKHSKASKGLETKKQRKVLLD